MPEWASTLLGVVVGGALAGLVTVLTLRWQLREERRRRSEDALRDRREKGAAVVGPVWALLGDADPDPLMLWAGNPGMDERARQLADRWQSLRDSLGVYGIGHSSREVGDVASQLGDAVDQSLRKTFWGMRMVVDPQMRGHVELVEVREAVLREYRVAVTLADDLRRLVRESSA